MGKSARSDIGFGRVLKPYDDEYNEIVYPWAEHDDIEEWWMFESGFVKLNFYTEDEMARLPGVTDEDLSNYYSAQQEWKKAHPCPVKIMECGTYDESEKVLIVPESHIHGDWEGSTKFRLQDMIHEESKQLTAYLEFCSTYKIALDSEDSWYLTSFWS